MKLPSSVIIKEVGPRDGLQNEKVMLATSHKVKWIHLLADTGISYIEASSFVHPKWIPALADATEVFQQIKRKQDVTYAALVPNQIGLERALAAGVNEVNVFLSASETHNKKNMNQTISGVLAELKEVAAKSVTAGKKVRAYVSVVFGCPYEGDVDITVVEEICEELFTSGIYEISLGDTIGVAHPLQVEQVIERLCRLFPVSRFAMHFHNTYGMALANVLKSLEGGITTFDSACGGLGGCPYAPGASGNIATNDLIHFLHKIGISTNTDEEKLFHASSYVQKHLGVRLPSHVYQAMKHTSVRR